MVTSAYPKQAAVNSPGDQAFESAFSNLSHAYLREKAPTLLDHELGFQLVDRNEEGDRALGVLGFQIGSTLLYAPQFFIKGKLKGHDMLYLQNQDLFVPLKENWLNYLLNRKPNTLGQRVDRNSRRLGVLSPNLERLTTPPGKYASSRPAGPLRIKLAQAFRVPEAAVWDCDTAADARQALQDFRETVSLPRLLKVASVEMLGSLASTCLAYPWFAQAIDARCGLETLGQALRTARSREKVGVSVLDPQPPRRGSYVLDEPAVQHPLKTGALKVLTYDLTVVTGGLSQDELEQLQREKVLIRDRREDGDVSRAYRLQVQQKLTNPTETGLYWTLVEPGHFERCLIVVHPHGPAGRGDFSTLVRLDQDNPSWCNSHPSRLWTASQESPLEFRRWWEKLPDASDAPRSRWQIFVGQQGDGTMPVRLSKFLGDEDGQQTFNANFEMEAAYAQRASQHRLPGAPRGALRIHKADPCFACGPYRLHLSPQDHGKLRSHGDELYVPSGFKRVSLEPARGDDPAEDVPSGGESRRDAIRPGRLQDAELRLGQEAKLAEFKLVKQGQDYILGGRTHSSRSALLSLVAGHGFREQTARSLLQEADRDGRAVCLVKYARPYLDASSPNAPPMPDFESQSGNSDWGYDGASQRREERYLPAGDRPTNPRGLQDKFDSQSMQAIQQAADTGQEEVFDTHVFSAMLKMMNVDRMIDDGLPDLITAMDRLARIRIMFYWHGDKFAERYGKHDLPDLEDALQNSFETLGETVLELRTKEISPFPDEDNAAIDLAGAAS